MSFSATNFSERAPSAGYLRNHHGIKKQSGEKMEQHNVTKPSINLTQFGKIMFPVHDRMLLIKVRIHLVSSATLNIKRDFEIILDLEQLPVVVSVVCSSQYCNNAIPANNIRFSSTLFSPSLPSFILLFPGFPLWTFSGIISSLILYVIPAHSRWKMAPWHLTLQW